VANRPPTAVDKSPALQSTWRPLSRGFFNPLLNRRKRDERKALGAALPGKMRPFREVGGFTRDALVGMARKTRAGPPASAPPHAKSLIRRSFAATTKTQGQLLEHRFHFGQGVAQDVKGARCRVMPS
jgi:hypothetical protein